MAKMETVAELVAWRALDEIPPNPRQAAPTFKPGQYKARITPAGRAQLSFVDSAGSLIVILLEKRGDEWFLASTYGIRISHISMELIVFPRHFQISELMARALKQAEDERTELTQKRKRAKQK